MPRQDRRRPECVHHAVASLKASSALPLRNADDVAVSRPSCRRSARHSSAGHAGEFEPNSTLPRPWLRRNSMELVHPGHRSMQVNRRNHAEPVGMREDQFSHCLVRDQRPRRSPPCAQHPVPDAGTVHAVDRPRHWKVALRQCTMAPPPERVEHRQREELRGGVLHARIDRAVTNGHAWSPRAESDRHAASTIAETSGGASTPSSRPRRARWWAGPTQIEMNTIKGISRRSPDAT